MLKFIKSFEEVALGVIETLKLLSVKLSLDVDVSVANVPPTVCKTLPPPASALAKVSVPQNYFYDYHLHLLTIFLHLGR